MKTAKSIPPTDDELEQGKRAVAKARRHFTNLRDTRCRRGKRHGLVNVVLISLMAMLCGCDDADDIAQWAELREDWLSQWFELTHGTPSQDTILRVFSLLKPKSFACAVMSWLSVLRPPDADHVAIDGKTLRGSRDRAKGQNGIHVVSAWLRDAGLVLGQVKTADKSNEMTAIPELLKIIDIRGCVVTIDAGGCYRDIASDIVSQGGHYALAVKENQPTLRHDIEELFTQGDDDRRRAVDEISRPALTHTRETDTGHGRIEERRVSYTTDLDWLTTGNAWRGLCGVGRTRTTAANLGTLRRTALSLLRATAKPKKRMSIKHQRRVCDYRADYLLEVLAARPPKPKGKTCAPPEHGEQAKGA